MDWELCVAELFLRRDIVECHLQDSVKVSSTELVDAMTAEMAVLTIRRPQHVIPDSRV